MPANDIILTFIAQVSGFIGGINQASRSIGEFGQGLQQLGVQLGILSIQFEQFSKLVIAGISPILDEGIKLQAALDEVRSVAPDLNAKFQRFTRTTLTTSEAVGEVADALGNIAGLDVISGVEKAAAGLDTFTTNADEAKKFLSNLTSEFSASGPEVDQFNRRISELTSSGATFTQALRTLAAERNFDALKEQIVSLAETTKFTAIEVSEAAKFLALAGFDAAEIRQALPETLNLAAAGSLDLGRASDIATNSLLAFRLEAFSLNRVVDTLAFTAAQSNTSVEQLGNAFKYAAPFASALGFSVEETAAALGKLGDVGIQATCHDDQTEVLTSQGWIPWTEASLAESYATVNPHTHNLEYQKASEIHVYDYSGPMYSVRNTYLDFKVTKNHRMYVKRNNNENFEILFAEEIVGKKSRYLGTVGYDTEDADSYVLPGIDKARGRGFEHESEKVIPADLWAQFMGLYLAEGCVTKGKKGEYKVLLAQQEGGRAFSLMEDVLGKLPFKFSYDGKQFRCYSQQLYDHLLPFGKALDKFIPDYLMSYSRRQLRLFLHAFSLGDGDASFGKLYTSSPFLADDLQTVALKCGYATRKMLRTPPSSPVMIGDRAIRADNQQYTVNYTAKYGTEPWSAPGEFKRRLAARGVKDLKYEMDLFEGYEEYEGKVYCATVPNGLLITRRNGKILISGNSAGNSLANAFRALAKRGDNFDAVLEELGLTLRDVDPQFNSLVDILRAFERAGATTNQIIRAFSIRGGRAVASLINQGIDELDALTNAIENADFSALDVAATRIENVAGQLLLLRSQLSAIASSVFDTIRGDVEKFLSFVSELLRKVREFIKANPAIAEAIVKISVFAAAASAAIAGLLVLISGPVSLVGIVALITAFSTQMAAAATTIASFAVVLAPVAALLAGSLGIVFVAISQDVEFFKRALLEASVAVKEFAQDFIEGFVESFRFVGESINGVTESLKSFSRALSRARGDMEGGANAAENLGSVLGRLFGELAGVLSLAVSIQLGLWTAVIELLRLTTLTLDILTYSMRATIQAIFAMGDAFVGNIDRAREHLLKADQEITNLRNGIDQYRKAFDDNGPSSGVLLTVTYMTNLRDAVREVNAELKGTQKSSSRLVELMQDFQNLPLKSVEELLEGIRKKQEDTGGGTLLDALQVEAAAAQKSLEELTKRRDALLAVGDLSPESAVIRNSLDREIAALQRLVDTYEEQRKAIEQFSKESGLSVAEFERAVSARLDLLKAKATDLGREFEFLNQKVGNLRQGNQDLRLEFDLEELKRSGKEFEANIKQLRESSTAEIKKLSQEIIVQQKIIDATLEQLLIERTATNEANLVREVEKIRELNERKILLEKKLQSELAELQKKENERKAKEAEKAAEEAAKAAKKAADEEAKRQDLLRDLEIDALRAQGKEKQAIEAEFQRSREEAEKRFQDLGLEGVELAAARANLEIKLDKDRKDALASLNGEQERRVENSKKAADYENDVFKSLLGEVKTARDLVVLFVLLNQLRIARFKIANQAARGALSANEQLLKIESRIDRARENGNEQAVKALSRQRDLLAIRAGLLEANATNLARALGADRIIDVFNLDSLRDRVENQGAEIFANAPKSWAEAFTAAFPPQAARMIAQVQAFVLQIRQIMQNAAPNIGAAAAGVANFQPGVAQAAAQFPDVAANFNRAFGVGGAAAGLGGAVGNAAPAPARAGGGNVPVNRIVNINVNNAQDVDKVKRAIAQEVNRAGFRVGDI